MRLLLAAGDPSGDLYASLLARELKRQRPGIEIDAVGGPLTKAALGDGLLHADLASLGVTGFVEPVRRLPAFLSLYRKLRELFRQGRYDAVVPIDFYGFNRRLMAAAKSAGLPVYYFISPQVWASRPGRIKVLKRLVDCMLVIFPFEEKLYKEAGVPVHWVGHPLLDLLPPPAERPLGSTLRLGLLPGSRPSELRRHLPLFLSAASLILEKHAGAEVTVFAAGTLPDFAYQEHLASWRGPNGETARLVRDEAYGERARQDYVLTSSGTATLENALLGLPMTVVYKLSWPTYMIARSLIRVPFIAMANILSGKKVVDELIQGDAVAEAVAGSALSVLADEKRLSAMRRELLSLREALGGPGAVGRAARRILSEISQKAPV